MSIKKGKNFRYGVHVKDMKEFCRDKPIELMCAPDTVYLSLSQHIGAPALPTVNVGDKVKKGQLIGQASAFVSANVYASVSGTVVEVKNILNGLGNRSCLICARQARRRRIIV